MTIIEYLNEIRTLLLSQLSTLGLDAQLNLITTTYPDAPTKGGLFVVVQTTTERESTVLNEGYEITQGFVTIGMYQPLPPGRDRASLNVGHLKRLYSFVVDAGFHVDAVEEGVLERGSFELTSRRLKPGPSTLPSIGFEAVVEFSYRFTRAANLQTA